MPKIKDKTQEESGIVGFRCLNTLKRNLQYIVLMKDSDNLSQLISEVLKDYVKTWEKKNGNIPLPKKK